MQYSGRRPVLCEDTPWPHLTTPVTPSPHPSSEPRKANHGAEEQNLAIVTLIIHRPEHRTCVIITDTIAIKYIISDPIAIKDFISDSIAIANIIICHLRNHQ